MIFYFSGTGNSAWAARQLAHLTSDEAYDITALTNPPDIQTAEQIGFVFPIYAWGAPEPMIRFAKKLKKTRAFTYGVCTCGGEAGLAMKIFSGYYPLDSSYSLVMPNNYIVGMDAEPEDVIMKKISQHHSGPDFYFYPESADQGSGHCNSVGKYNQHAYFPVVLCPEENAADPLAESGQTRHRDHQRNSARGYPQHAGAVFRHCGDDCEQQPCSRIWRTDGCRYGHRQ